MTIKDWNIEEMTGYKPISTFYTDFSIADAFYNVDAGSIMDTFNNGFESFKNDYKMMTELTLVLNWKIWEHYGSNDTLAELYDKLWRRMDSWCLKKLKGEELAYYLKTVD